jgi:small-conductance mechanosensitive channel
MPATLLTLATAGAPAPDASEEILTDGLTSGDWIRAAAIVVGSIIVAVVVGRITRALLGRTIGDGFAAIITARVIAYIVFVTGFFYALTSLGVRVGPLIGALGLSGLVLALALQKVVENFVGGLILQARRPYTVGDTIDLDGHVGVVVDIDSRTTVLRRLDGSQVRIPNGEVLATAIVNLTREGLRRSELPVGVAYDSDLERATEVLTDAVGRVPRVAKKPAPWVMLRQFGASSIDFTVFYWHQSDVPSELAATHDLILAVHHALADAGITIAFPQMVVWSGHDADGDPYRRPPEPVFTERAAAPPAPAPSDDEVDGPRWRLPWRR